MSWEVILLSEVKEWFDGLDDKSTEQVTTAIDLLEKAGPTLGRPLVDTLQGSSLPNLKELRPGSTGRSEVRILFVFDPKRRAVLLVAGDKSGQWKKWDANTIPLAEQRYKDWRAGDYDEEDL